MNSKRNVVLAVVVIAVALSTAIWWPQAERATEVVSPARSSEPGAVPAYPPALPSYDEPLPTPAPAFAQANPNVADLCQYGKVNPEQIPAALEAVADAMLLRVVDEFERSREPRKRALGLATQAWIDAEAADRRT